jgi:protein-S-isoprenylcysteine O-methyltransferase Ste14
MFARAVLAFVALPGVVAFAIPITWLVSTSHTVLVRPAGLAPLLIGVVGLLWCVRDFYVSGRGTLAPWSPPANLVVTGLYRYSRNPMHVAVTLIIVGWALCFAVPGLFGYAVLVAVAFHVRVVLAEEPWLARTHGDEWERYSHGVRRWL